MIDSTYKVCLFGDGNVGKTTLVNRYLTGVFKDNTNITIGVNFHLKKMHLNGQSIQLQIWDFAGEECFRSLMPGYAKGAMGGIFMYDITRSTTLNNIIDWLKVFRKGTNNEEIPLFMVGGKLDLEKKRSIERKYAIEVADSNGFQGFAECSAKTGVNVEKAFEVLTELISTQYHLNSP